MIIEVITSSMRKLFIKRFIFLYTFINILIFSTPKAKKFRTDLNNLHLIDNYYMSSIPYMPYMSTYLKTPKGLKGLNSVSYPKNPQLYIETDIFCKKHKVCTNENINDIKYNIQMVIEVKF